MSLRAQRTLARRLIVLTRPHARSYLVLISFLLPTMTRLIFSTFPCLELDTGERWLLADKSIDCDGAAHVVMVAYVRERSE